MTTTTNPFKVIYAKYEEEQPLTLLCGEIVPQKKQNSCKLRNSTIIISNGTEISVIERQNWKKTISRYWRSKEGFIIRKRSSGGRSYSGRLPLNQVFADGYGTEAAALRPELRKLIPEGEEWYSEKFSRRNALGEKFYSATALKTYQKLYDDRRTSVFDLQQFQMLARRKEMPYLAERLTSLALENYIEPEVEENYDPYYPGDSMTLKLFSDTLPKYECFLDNFTTRTNLSVAAATALEVREEDRYSGYFLRQVAESFLDTEFPLFQTRALTPIRRGENQSLQERFEELKSWMAIATACLRRQRKERPFVYRLNAPRKNLKKFFSLVQKYGEIDIPETKAELGEEGDYGKRLFELWEEGRFIL